MDSSQNTKLNDMFCPYIKSEQEELEMCMTTQLMCSLLGS